MTEQNLKNFVQEEWELTIHGQEKIPKGFSTILDSKPAIYKIFF